MSKSFKEDLTGKRFGRLTVIEFVPTDNRRTYWKCTCDCGKTTIVWQPHLKRGKIASCGCFRREIASCKKKTHGDSKSRLYRIWLHMRARCNDRNNDKYKYYGERGIKVCSDWNSSYELFKEWSLENGYTEELTIDRIDVNGNYEPNNCRWISMEEQAVNKRNTIKVKYEGHLLSLREVSIRTNISLEILQNRYHKGERAERLFRPVKNK